MTILFDKKILIRTNSGVKISRENNKIKHKKWFSAAALISAIIFILLNIIPCGIGQIVDSIKSNKAPDLLFNKLQYFVKNSAYESEQFGPWPWWIARAYFSTPSPDIVAMGDSQINAAFIQADAIALNESRDCVTDRGCVALKKSLQFLDKTAKNANLQLVNLAIGGAMPSDYYLMSKALFTKEHHPKLVILSLSPRSFLDATLSSASATETFQFLSRYVDLANLVDYAFTNPIEKYFWLAKNQLTAFKYRQDINLVMYSFIKKLFNSVNNKTEISSTQKLSSDRLPTQAIYGGNGFVTIGNNVVTPNPNVPFKGNKQEYEKRFSQLKPQTIKAQSTYFIATLKRLNELHIKVVVVDMPMLAPVRDLLPVAFWSNYSAQLKKDCQENGAYWIDLSNDPEFSQANFLDYVHLNSKGGKLFVDRLASGISKIY